METKEPIIEIVAPEGYEVDNEKSTLERIVFKKKDDGKPRSWKEFCEKYPNTKGEYYIGGESSEIIEINHQLIRSSDLDKTLIKTKEEAEAFLALMQLRQLRKAWVSDWESNWNNGSESYLIRKYENMLSYGLSRNSGPLTFPTEIMASEFFYCFKDLLEQAKMLL